MSCHDIFRRRKIFSFWLNLELSFCCAEDEINLEAFNFLRNRLFFSRNKSFFSAIFSISNWQIIFLKWQLNAELTLSVRHFTALSSSVFLLRFVLRHENILIVLFKLAMRSFKWRLDKEEALCATMTWHSGSWAGVIGLGESNESTETERVMKCHHLNTANICDFNFNFSWTSFMQNNMQQQLHSSVQLKPTAGLNFSFVRQSKVTQWRLACIPVSQLARSARNPVEVAIKTTAYRQRHFPPNLESCAKHFPIISGCSPYFATGQIVCYCCAKTTEKKNFLFNIKACPANLRRAYLCVWTCGRETSCFTLDSNESFFLLPCRFLLLRQR